VREHLERSQRCYRKNDAPAFKGLRQERDVRFESTLRTTRYALTQQIFPNYIAAMDAAMDNELSSLEEKIRQAAELCRQLRRENRELRQQVVALQGTRRQLEQKIDGARDRLERLVGRMPE
jgi:cell division protein ZapB